MLGEDSGIECDALGGEPGLHSARWAPRGDQADALLERLGGRAEPAARGWSPRSSRSRRTARSCAAAACSRARSRPSGAATGGFGYDPIFVPDGEERTVAELGDDWKREHSHRGRAARALDGGRRAGGERDVRSSRTVASAARAARASSPRRRARSRSPSRRARRAAAPATTARAAPGCGSRRSRTPAAPGTSPRARPPPRPRPAAPRATSAPRSSARSTRSRGRRRCRRSDTPTVTTVANDRVVDDARVPPQQLRADRARPRAPRTARRASRPSSATPAPCRAGSRGSAGRRRC